MNKTYAFWKKRVGGFFRWLYNIKIHGAENEPMEGSLLVCANHLSNRDVIIIAASLKRQLRYLAKAELFKVPILRRIVSALGAIPVDRKTNDVGAIKKANEVLRDGEVLAMFPQGTRCPGVHPKDTKIKFGAAMIAGHTGASVLPVYLQTKDHRIKLFRRVDMIVGKPIPFEEIKASGESYKEQAEFIFSKILELEIKD